MIRISLESLSTARFRANPSYDLVLFERLEPQERAVFGRLEEDKDTYGILRPKGDGLTIRSISREAALLFLTLREPGILPGYFRRLFAERATTIATELVLDRVLEIESAGLFVSGVLASDEALPATSAQAAPRGLIEELSRAALKYAQSLAISAPVELSARLYFYNRAPASPRWKRMASTDEAVAQFLTIDSSGTTRAILDRAWSETEPRAGRAGWRSWTGRHHDHRDGHLGFKLYVSPRTDHLPEALRAALDVFTARRVPRFKIGADIHGLLRPDKLVAYLGSIDELMELANALTPRLAGTPPHGVPFTSEISCGGLLSWGMDPPRDEHVLQWQERSSWRSWVTNRLASAIVSAQAQPPGRIEPWQFALERVTLEGVDTRTWTPRQSMWAGATSNGGS